MNLQQMIEAWEITHGTNTLLDWRELTKEQQQQFIFETFNDTIKRLSNKIDSLKASKE